jgi:putative NADPH-quinone reductase
MKQILIINGHPNPQSFNYALAQAYKQGANKNDSVVVQLNIADLKFDPNLRYGYSQRMELEPDLADAIKKIKAADHIVWIYPMWWYGYPALMKGFIDRTFLPGITFRPRKGKLPEPLLKGKTARIIITSDTPRWYNFLFMKSPATNQLKKGTLQFCGINPVKVTYISPLEGSAPAFRKKWLDAVISLGAQSK